MAAPGRGLAVLSTLEVLDLSFNSIESLNGLQMYSLPYLKFFSVSHNGLARFDSLENLPSLRDLDLSYNKLRKLESPFEMPQVRFLKIGFNALRTLSYFEGFPGLQMLSINNNRIADFTEIDKIAKLRELADLNLCNNPVTKKHMYRVNIIKRLKGLVLLDMEQVGLGEKAEKRHEPRSASLNNGGGHKAPIKMSSVTFDDFIIPQSSPGEMRKRPSPYRRY